MLASPLLGWIIPVAKGDIVDADASTPPSGKAVRTSAIVASEGGRLPTGARIVHRSARGELTIHIKAPRTMLIEVTGHAEAGFVDFIESVFEATFGASNGVCVYIDCEAQTGHDAAFRERLVDWARGIHPRTRTYCLLVRSRIVGFGLTVANMLVGGHAVTLTDRAAFEAKLDQSIREALAESVT